VPQFTIVPQTPAVGMPVDFNAATTTGPAPIATYSWNFGNGSTGSGVTAQTTYAAPGSYTVTLTVVDTVGRTSTITRTLTVPTP
jgi:PKD repeat protein